ncbi:hypothetical protein L2091_01750 [Curtobacterium albidum]|uniref:hypothetical protein n=1 Tax=Curtobacterium citreum TaxID=2036 RepID=UPI00073698D5|nr:MULTISPECIES: hypothetical protein [Curtobacterium]KTR23166.1 hypothetical protein NS330_03390 [Curtobacterium citreum]MCL9663953.1 hypothetical protein [Curtobacterium albidum]
MSRRTTESTHRQGSPILGRVRFWWHASTEIHELTRDHDLEERVIAESAIQLSPGPSNIAWLFRRGRPRPAAQSAQTGTSRATSN